MKMWEVAHKYNKQSKELNGLVTVRKYSKPKKDKPPVALT